MARDRRLVQANHDKDSGTKYRMPVYHLKDHNGRTPFVHLGRDRNRAQRFAPMIATLIEDCRTVEEARVIATRILREPSDDGAKRVADSILRTRLRVSVETEAKADARCRAEYREVLADHGLQDDEIDLVIARGDYATPWRRSEPNTDFIQRHPELKPNPQDFRGRRDPWAPRAVSATTATCSKRLSDCLAKWIEVKRALGIGKNQIEAVEKTFKLFIKSTGNVPVDQLAEQHFADWEIYVLKIRGKRGPRWVWHMTAPLGNVLRLCKRKTDWPLPDGVSEWVQIFDSPGKYTPDPHNDKPLPAATFRAMLEVVDRIAALTPGEYAKELPVKSKLAGRKKKLAEWGNVARARRIITDAVQWAAILRYALNTGADNKDIERLEWSHLYLKSAPPYMQFARPKTERHHLPYRCTPLLPSTVAALNRWRELRPLNSPRVFRSYNGKHYASNKVSKGFERWLNRIGHELRADEHGKEWYFKHQRNVGPNLARDAHRPGLEISAFLGHAPDKTNADTYYLSQHGPKYLVDVVNLIGAAYFNGEQITLAPAAPDLDKNGSIQIAG